jgi:hypothetical protein
MRLKIKIAIYVASTVLSYSSFVKIAYAGIPQMAFCPDKDWIMDRSHRMGNLILEQPGTGTGPMRVSNPDFLDNVIGWKDTRVLVSSGRIACDYEGKTDFNILSESRNWLPGNSPPWHITSFIKICKAGIEQCIVHK